MEISNLDFKPHSTGLGGTQAEISFDNGYGASVLTGEMFYTSDDGPYEVAVLHNGKLAYDTHITSDVLGHQTVEDVEKLLDAIQALPEKIA